jgi:hypothetical protein
MGIMMLQLKRLFSRQGISEFLECYRGVTIALCAVSAIGPRNEIAEFVTAELERNPSTTADL